MYVVNRSNPFGKSGISNMGQAGAARHCYDATTLWKGGVSVSRGAALPVYEYFLGPCLVPRFLSNPPEKKRGYWQSGRGISSKITQTLLQTQASPHNLSSSLKNKINPQRRSERRSVRLINVNGRKEYCTGTCKWEGKCLPAVTVSQKEKSQPPTFQQIWKLRKPSWVLWNQNGWNQNSAQGSKNLRTSKKVHRDKCKENDVTRCANILKLGHELENLVDCALGSSALECQCNCYIFCIVSAKCIPCVYYCQNASIQNKIITWVLLCTWDDWKKISPADLKYNNTILFHIICTL